MSYIYVTIYYGPELHHYHRAKVVRACVDMFGSHHPLSTTTKKRLQAADAAQFRSRRHKNTLATTIGGLGPPTFTFLTRSRAVTQMCTSPASATPGTTNQLGTPLGNTRPHGNDVKSCKPTFTGFFILSCTLATTQCFRHPTRPRHTQLATPTAMANPCHPHSPPKPCKQGFLIFF